MQLKTNSGGLWGVKLCACLLFATMMLTTFADESIDLIWNPSNSSDVVGYNIYYGAVNTTSTNEISVGNLTNLTVPGLAPGITYFFTITAINSSRIESDQSSPMYYSVPVKAAIFGQPFTSRRGMSMPVNGLTGHLYIIQVSTNLADWTSVETNLTPLLITDTNSIHHRQEFYRAIYIN